jgi:hypothetical protein
MKGALIAPRASVDLGSKPARLNLGDGTTVELDSVLCSAQSCAIAPPAGASGKIAEGTLLGAPSMEGS